MSRRSAVVEVARTTASLWLRELSKLFRTSERVVLLAAIGAFVVALAFGSLLALLSSSQLNATVPPELKVLILRTAFGGSIVTTSIIATILCITSPQRTTLQTLLDLLPVSRRGASIGQLLPLIVTGFVFSVTLSGTAVAVLVKTTTSAFMLVLSIVLLLLIVAVTLAFSIGTFRLLDSVLRRYVRLPGQYSASISAVCVIGLGVASVASDILALAPARNSGFTVGDMLPHRAAALVVADSGALVGCVVLALWVVIGVGLVAISGELHRQDLEPRIIRAFRGTRPPAGSFLASLWAEALIAIRAPQTIVTVLALVPAIAVVGWLTTNAVLASAAYSLAAGIPSMPFLLAIYAVGRTADSRWTGKHLTANASWWVFPKLCAYALLAMAIAIPVVLIEMCLSLVGADELVEIGPRALLAFGSAFVGGTLVPYSEEQPLSVTASGFITAILFLGISLGLSWASQYLNPVQANSVTLGIALVLLALHWLIATNYVTEREGA